MPSGCATWWPVSETRDALRHPLTRTSETNWYQNGYDSSAAFRFEFQGEIAQILSNFNSGHHSAYCAAKPNGLGFFGISIAAQRRFI
jgi:hypothetical protein